MEIGEIGNQGKKLSKTDDPRVDLVLDELCEDDSVLDIGCVQHSADREFTNHWLHGELYEYSNNVVGIDYLSEEIERLQERGYNVICANAEDYDLNEKFDVIIAGELIEHLENPGKFLDSTKDHLEKDGKIVMTTPNPWYFRRFIEASFGDVHCNPGHTCWFDKRTLRQIFSRNGLEITEFKYIRPGKFDPPTSVRNIERYLHRVISFAGFSTLAGESIFLTAEHSSSTTTAEVNEME